MLILFSACTYSFKGFIKESYSKVYISVFLNKSEKAGIEAAVTENFINYWDDDGRIEIAGENTATMILLGTLKNYKVEPYEYKEDGSVLSYKVVIRAEFTLKDKSQSEPLWSGKTFSAWGKYQPYTEIEDNGVERAAIELARKVLEAYLTEAK